MGVTATAIYAPGDIITSAWANILRSNTSVLDSRTGGDPGASGKIPVSNGAASSIWTGVGPAIVAGLGYLPANAAGQAFTGSISAPSVVAGAGGISSSAGVAAVDVVASNLVSAALFSGGTPANGSVAALSLQAGPGGIASAGPISATAAIVSGAVQGTQLKSTVAGPTAPLDVNGNTTVVPSLNASLLRGIQPSTVSVAGVIPIADGAGKLDAWVTPAVAGATVPSGAIVAFDVLASLTAAGAGWTRHTAADGRLLVGDGTTFGQPFAQGGAYGASWAHAHSTPVHQHSGSSMSVGGSAAATGSTDQANVSTPGTAFALGGHTHSISGSVGGATNNDGNGTSGPTTWLPAMLGVVWGRKL